MTPPATLPAEQTDTGGPVLEMSGITKRFFGTVALHEVNFAAWSGEVHALMGENGAGKSTLMKILGALHRPDAGEIRLGGRTLWANGPREVQAAGISLIHQELSLVPELSVAENIFLGAERCRAGFLLDRMAMVVGAARLLEPLNAGFSATARVGELSIANRQLVEIARSLRGETRVLVMDEPTAALSDRESERLFAVVDELRSRGTAIIYISHRMAEVERLADRVTVLRDGRWAGTLAKSEINSRRIVQMMVGRPPQEFYSRTQRRPIGRTVLQVHGLGDGGRIRNLNFELRAGEVVGLAGLVGAGRTEIARMIFGANPAKTGTIAIEGKAARVRTPAEAIRRGIAYVPEDRKEQGLFLELGADTNMTINLAGPTARGGLLQRRRLRESAQAAIHRLGVRVREPSTPVLLLSGGNQQKVLLARWLSQDPKILILDEPTRGIDIGAKTEIYRLIDEQAARGMAVLLISSELAEIIALCDRVLVMREGKLVGELDGQTAAITQEAVMAFATGLRACA